MKKITAPNEGCDAALSPETAAQQQGGHPALLPDELKPGLAKLLNDIPADSTATPGEKTACVSLRSCIERRSLNGIKVQLHKLARYQEAGELLQLLGTIEAGSTAAAQEPIAAEPAPAPPVDEGDAGDTFGPGHIAEIVKRSARQPQVNADAETHTAPQDPVVKTEADAAEPAAAPGKPVLPFKLIPVPDIETVPELAGLFPLDEAVVDALTEDIRNNGFRPDHPLIVWVCNNNNVVVDGHTRLAAAKAADIAEVPAVQRDFTDIEDAVQFAISEQVNRRNLTPGEKLHLVMKLREPEAAAARERQENGLASAEAKGKTAENIGRKLHLGTSTVERMFRILDSGETDLIDQVVAGEVSVNAAADKLKLKKQSPAPDVKSEHAPAAEKQQSNDTGQCDEQRACNATGATGPAEDHADRESDSADDPQAAAQAGSQPVEALGFTGAAGVTGAGGEPAVRKSMRMMSDQLVERLNAPGHRFPLDVQQELLDQIDREPEYGATGATAA